MPTLGFVGLGNMGGPMAHNLATAGHEIICFDAAGTQLRAPPGAIISASVSEVSERAEIVFLCLPDGSTVIQVANSIIDASNSSVNVVVDNTTAGIADAQAAHALFAQSGISYIDAPVSGGTAGAAQGTLAMMVAATDELFATIEPYIRPMAQNARQVGTKPGQGMAMKLLNNFISGMSMTATSEAIRFGISQGLDMESMLETLNISTGRTTASEDKFPNRIASGTYNSGFATKLMVKDLRLYENSVLAAGTPNRLGTLLREIWDVVEKAHPDSDFTEIYKHLRDEVKN